MNVKHREVLLLEQHREIWQRYEAADINCSLDQNDKENEFESDWHHDHYFAVGRDAVRIIMSALLANKRSFPQTILDFPSGSGRVTRHLRALFSDAKIGACDLYKSHIDFCAQHFDATPFVSNENLDQLDIGKWDLIFCGSLLTHLPAVQFAQALRFLIRSLAPDGIVVATLEGRHSIFIQDNKWKFIRDDLFDIARKDFVKSGFGFVNYQHDFLQEKFTNQKSYGIALVSPAYIMNFLQTIAEIRVLNYTERDWDDHQDVVIFGKPGINQ